MPLLRFRFSVFRGTFRVLCFRCRPFFLGWPAAPPIPPATGRSFRVKVDQFPSLAPTRAFRLPGMNDSSRVQPATPERGLRQGRYGEERLKPITLNLRGRGLLLAPDRRSPHSFCQMRYAEGLFPRRGLANGEGEVGGRGEPGRGSSAPSRGARAGGGTARQARDPGRQAGCELPENALGCCRCQ